MLRCADRSGYAWHGAEVEHVCAPPPLVQMQGIFTVLIIASRSLLYKSGGMFDVCKSWVVG